MPGSTISVTNKGDFGYETRKSFGHQDIVQKVASGFEIGQFLLETHGGDEKSVAFVAEEGLDKALDWVRTSYSLLIMGKDLMVAYCTDSANLLHIYINSGIAVVSSDQLAVTETIEKTGGNRDDLLHSIPRGTYLIKRR